MKSMDGPSDDNPATQNAMQSALPSYSEAVGVSQVQEISPPVGFYPAQQPISYSTPGNPTYIQQQPFITTQPPYPHGQSNQTVYNVMSPAAAVNPGRVYTSVGPGPTIVKCLHCQEDVLTMTTKRCSCQAHCCCLFMFITGICTLFSCLPYCMRSCKVVTHRCPNCKKVIGRF